VPNLLTAVVETKSAFGGSDANGHFVRIQAITGACTLGLSAGCASPGTSQAQGSGQPPGSAPTQQTLTGGQATPALPTGSMTDRDLLGLFLGN
jgi:hypothetical protein